MTQLNLFIICKCKKSYLYWDENQCVDCYTRKTIKIWRKTSAYRTFCKKRLKFNNPAIRARENLRRRLKKILKNKHNQKHECGFGYTAQMLRKRLESRFKYDMTWNNYGKVWSIDHIIALYHFDLTKKEQRIAANALTNLQPLYCQENSRKGARYVTI